MPVYSVNRQIVCHKPEKITPTREEGRAFAGVREKTGFIKLEVAVNVESDDGALGPGSMIGAGDIIYLRGDAMAQQWYRAPLTLELGSERVEVIIVPLEFVVMVEPKGVADAV